MDVFERKRGLTADRRAPYYTERFMVTPFHSGLRHLALRVSDLRRSRAFYERFLGMKVVWEPDGENIYFSSGNDNLALHQIPAAELNAYQPGSGQRLDHFGVIVESPQAVDAFFADVQHDAARFGATIAKPPKQHRDGSYSFYFTDPDGNMIQALYEPTVSKLKWVNRDA